MMDLCLVAATSDLIAVASAAVAVGTAGLAWYSLRESRRLAHIMANYDFMTSAESMFIDHPELLKLHGITPDKLKDLEVSVPEVVYLLRSFRGGKATVLIDRDLSERRGLPSDYRERLMESKKAQAIWRLARSKGMFSGDDPWARGLDELAGSD